MQRELLDRQAIHDVVLRYCRGIDRLDFDLVRSCYHPDAIDHHTGFDGSVDDYIAWVRPKLETLGGTMHHVGNHLVELFGDVAIAETYSMNVHWGHPAGGDFTSGARFVDLMERRDGRWAIAQRWAVREWTRSDADRMTAPEAAGPRGRRDGQDLVQRLRDDILAEKEPSTRGRILPPDKEIR
ncbi:nuclear transport factor 2 family protein [Rhodococcus sp. D2-41]|uniref:nuclear transport factor 2 family protein n=1 Tax=Speluncibacter jeojiensis TaxID=2710754 RepID=UPI00240F7D20|nr:nuclear transport factor 2 family protein [Rhodococcus sp. D2-41]MDG3011664.1 nuclear transport factor 2 family protein [Rhodococcus sp. D2-41]